MTFPVLSAVTELELNAPLGPAACPEASTALPCPSPALENIAGLIKAMIQKYYETHFLI